MKTSTLFKRHIALPQDHGSWVFILSPLLIGLFAGKVFTPASLTLIIAAMAAFLIRQPVSVAIKAYAGRRSRDDLPAARFWMVVYGIILILAVSELLVQGYIFVIHLAVPGILVFAWHLYLVSKRAERRQAGVEILATGVLALAAPAAYWAGSGSYDPWGWALWALAWFQSAASVMYAYLRLQQRELKTMPTRAAQFQMGWRPLLYVTFNLGVTVILSITQILPAGIFIPYFVQWAETLYGVMNPAVGAKPTAIGVRQLIVSILFTVLFIVFWRR